MEPIWEQDKDAGYDFSDEAYAADNAYYSTYGGNACLVCLGGSYVRNVNIKTASASAYPAYPAYPAYSAYSKYGGNADDYYEEEDHGDHGDHGDYEEEDCEDHEVYDDDTNDY